MKQYSFKDVWAALWSLATMAALVWDILWLARQWGLR